MFFDYEMSIKYFNQKNEEDKKEEIERFKKENEAFFEKATVKRDLSNLEDLRKYSDSGADKRYNNTIYIILNVFSQLDKSCNFISSFRSHPERTYIETTKDILKIEKFGEGYLDQIRYWQDKEKNMFNYLIKTMKSLSLLHSIKTKRIGGGRIEIAVQVKKDGPTTLLTDVGFGISQFLPIIVADMQLNSYQTSTLFIAQPEIHLHPSAQATFADYMCEQIKEKDKNYVIETHSEYILNRLRLKIVQKKFNPDNLKIYFLEDTSSEPIIHEIKFGRKGEVIGAPKSFFDTYLMDLKDIALSV